MLTVVNGTITDSVTSNSVHLRLAHHHGNEDEPTGKWKDPTGTYSGAWTESVVKANLDAIKSYGANGIRVWIRADYWINNTVDDNAVATRTSYANLCEWANDRGLYVIVCGFSLNSGSGTHTIPWGTATFPTQQDFVDFWISVANTLKTYPNVAYELWNEVTGSLDTWLTGCEATIQGIRTETDALILVGWWWDVWYRMGTYAGALTIEWAADARILNYDNIAVATHMYKDSRGYRWPSVTDGYPEDMVWFFLPNEINTAFGNEKLLDCVNGTGAFSSFGKQALVITEFGSGVPWSDSGSYVLPPHEYVACDSALTWLSLHNIGFALMWWWVGSWTSSTPYGMWTETNNTTTFAPTDWGKLCQKHFVGFNLDWIVYVYDTETNVGIQDAFVDVRANPSLYGPHIFYGYTDSDGIAAFSYASGSEVEIAVTKDGYSSNRMYVITGEGLVGGMYRIGLTRIDPITPPTAEYYTVTCSAVSHGQVYPEGLSEPIIVGQPFYATASADQDYKFSYWTLDGTQVSTDPTFVFTQGLADRNYVLVAYFEADTPTTPDDPTEPDTGYFSVNIESTVGGSVSPEGEQTLPAGETIIVSQTPDDNYRFLYWLVDGTTQVHNSSDYYLVGVANTKYTLLAVYQKVIPNAPNLPLVAASGTMAPQIRNRLFGRIVKELQRQQPPKPSELMKKLKKVHT